MATDPVSCGEGSKPESRLRLYLCMGSPPNNPVGRLCFRCGVTLGGDVARDGAGREVCGSCAMKAGAAARAGGMTAGGGRVASLKDDGDERVRIDLGPSEPLPPLAREKPVARERPAALTPGVAFPPRVEAPVDVVEITPSPKRLAPAKPAPELEDMSKYAPANQYRPRVASTDSGGEIPERKCSKCGYSLEGLETNTCPECGHENTRRRRGKSQLLEEESRQIARMEYIKPAVTLVLGMVVVMMILAIGGDWPAMLARVGGLPVRVLVGTFAYFLCCLWFFGFDSPWRLTALRLGAIYSISDIPFAAVHALNFPAATSMAYLAALAISVFMFVWLFELDPSDAWLLVAVTAVVNVVIGFGLAIVVSMVV